MHIIMSFNDVYDVYYDTEGFGISTAIAEVLETEPVIKEPKERYTLTKIYRVL